jgi:hypothetical protein
MHLRKWFLRKPVDRDVVMFAFDSRCTTPSHATRILLFVYTSSLRVAPSEDATSAVGTT